MKRIKIFICYASEDKELASTIARELEDGGVELFFDQMNVRPGDHISGQIREGLDECDRAVVIVGPEFKNKSYPQHELRYLRDHREWSVSSGRIIPVLAPEAGPEDLPPELANVHYLRWGDGRELGLARDIGRWCQQAGASSARRRRRWWWPLLAICTVVVISLGAAVAWWSRADVRSPGAAVGTFGQGTTAEDGSSNSVEVDEGVRVSGGEDSSPEPTGHAPTVAGFPRECKEDADCGVQAHCRKEPQTWLKRLGTVRKRIDRQSHSDLVGRRCPEGYRRTGKPRGKVDGRGECRVKWRTSDRDDCEVEVMVLGPSFVEIGCSVSVELRARTAAPGRCVARPGG